MAIFLIDLPQRLSDGSTMPVYVNPEHVRKVTPSNTGRDNSLIHFSDSDCIVINMSFHDVAHLLTR